MKGVENPEKDQEGTISRCTNTILAKTSRDLAPWTHNCDYGPDLIIPNIRFYGCCKLKKHAFISALIYLEKKFIYSFLAAEKLTK